MTMTTSSPILPEPAPSAYPFPPRSRSASPVPPIPSVLTTPVPPVSPFPPAPPTPTYSRSQSTSTLSWTGSGYESRPGSSPGFNPGSRPGSAAPSAPPTPGLAPPSRPTSRWANLSPWSSTTSLASVKSYRSTSSDHPLFMFKRRGNQMELPCELEIDGVEFHQMSSMAQQEQDRKAPTKPRAIAFQIAYWLFLACFIYFVLVGFPLWTGLVRMFWHFTHTAADSVWGMVGFLIWGATRAILPQLFCWFDKEVDDVEKRDASQSCLIIPCYKSAETLKSTLPAALRVFPPDQIFVIANGNSDTPLDDTEDVCNEFGVNHTWVPTGSKIVAEFVGVRIAKRFKYCMLIDDDVILPANLPLPTNQFTSDVACIGYTLRSTGANGSVGTLVQQAQDVEYKMAGLAKVFQSWYGSALFPHGAIALWDREILNEVFLGHPGYHISEDWYLGHTARSLGYRVIMTSQVFVDTETPPTLLWGGGGRGGYGEMTVWRQRFFRWNFFYVFRVYSNLIYTLLAWRLGWREFVTKIFVLGECYDSVIFLIAPITLPVMLISAWRVVLMATGILIGVYALVFIYFNAVHLRRRGQMVSWRVFPVYFGMKILLQWFNIASVYYAIYAYVSFFSKRHLRVTENVAAWRVVRSKLHGGS